MIEELLLWLWLFLRVSGFVQQGKCTRTAKSAAPSSLCFLPPVICDVMLYEEIM
jgi:hypothetical protein